MQASKYQISEPVLIVDDKASIRETIAELCTELGLPSECATNGEEALAMAEDDRYSLYIVDLKMPVMDGWTLVPKLKDKLHNPIILIATSINDPNQIIDVMKQGVFDYIIKPIDPELFMITLRKTIEHIYLRRQAEHRIRQSEKELQSKLEWLVYKENRRNQLADAEGKNLVYNLKTSISQGGGLGNAISIIDLIEALSTRDGENYIVPAQMLDMLFENNKISRNTTDGLNLINNILGHGIKPADMAVQDFVHQIGTSLAMIIAAAERKKLRITLPDLHTTGQFQIDLKLLNLVIEELLVNAMKYAGAGTEVSLYAHITKGFFCFSVMNRLADNDPATIPTEFETLILEPFYRHAKPNDEFYDLERFSLGLGLTVVEYIVQKHTGVFSIHQMRDHTQEKPRDCVLAEIQIPMMQN
ncbi:MAG: response regulator [Leptospiraceae bacterium]|nr:response regulator [Leptospiraceae bacterium]